MLLHIARLCLVIRVDIVDKCQILSILHSSKKVSEHSDGEINCWKARQIDHNFTSCGAADGKVHLLEYSMYDGCTSTRTRTVLYRTVDASSVYTCQNPKTGAG